MNSKKTTEPPKWADRILKAFCNEQVIETLQGDLYELYNFRRKLGSKLSADVGFVFDMLSVIRPFALKKFFISKNSSSMSMYKNYLKVSWRNLLRHRMYSTIKIGGLSIGIAVCILISLFVIDELGHDKDFPNVDQLYRLVNVWDQPGQVEKWESCQPMIADMMKSEFPEIENAGRLIPYSGWSFAGSNQVRRAGRLQNAYEEGFAYMDQELFEMLGFTMIYGNRSTALSEPNSMVISEAKAEKYFPGENPVGKMIILDEQEDRPWTIGGVMENPASNNHIEFDFLLTLTSEEFWKGEQTSFCCSNYATYFKVDKEADIHALEKKLAELYVSSYVPYLQERGDVEADDVGKYWAFLLQPIQDIYLRSERIHDSFQHSDIKKVWMFGSIAIFILLLACINFINLSTAKSANRAKEVGLRKVVGSFKSDLIKQFLTESTFISLVAVILGVLLAWIFVPFFNTISGKVLIMPFGTWWFFPSCLLLALIVGLIAGVYPSFYLSAFRPIEVLKGKLSLGTKTSRLRGGMVVFQFTCSVILIVGSMVVYRQMSFILNKDVGFSKEQVVLIEGANTLEKRLELFQDRLLKDPHVLNVTASSYLPITGSKRDLNTFWKEGKKKVDKGIGAQIWRVDDDYINTLGMELIAGRDFDKTSNRDSASLIINETFARELGLDSPIGARIVNWQSWTVIGVVKDFHFESMRGEIGGLGLASGRFGSVVPVKIKTEDMKATLASITAVWDEFMPNQPIRYSFMDEVFKNMYEDVLRTRNVFFVFAVLAIIVACLGLFALSSFMVEQRIKEISIRKVLGASASLIFTLLTSDFLKLIGISLILAIPASYFLMESWLEDFEYRTNLDWMIFCGAGCVIVVIALLTISFESLKAAFINPSVGLRSE
ncbi:MAG: ABC transporter permease [Bacteroidota bacterium]